MIIYTNPKKKRAVRLETQGQFRSCSKIIIL
jgi:hypothetical protein